MFSEFLSIIFRSLKLNNSLYKEKKFFSDSAIYFSISIVILTIIIQVIPNNVYLSWMSELGLWQNQNIKFRHLLFSGLFFWILKSLYLYIVGKFIFPNTRIKFSFLKILTAIGYSHAPLIFNVLAFRLDFLFFLFLTYIWYIASQTIAIDVLFDYKNKFKSCLIITAPLWIPIVISTLIIFIISFTR
tara:strand:- start:259 stop:819 length:561 start_codon:yes stop_codon:yes gene_type:complete